MKGLTHIFFVLLILCLPITSVLLAENAVSRAPDFYTYEFTKLQASQNVEGEISDKELGEFFSDFMMGKTKDFLFTSYDPEEEQEPFTEEEGKWMLSFRERLNFLLGPLAAAFVLLIAASVFFWRQGNKQKLRAAVKLSWGVFILLWAGLLPLLLHFDIPTFSGTDTFFQLVFNKDLIKDWIYVGIAGSILIMGILTSIFWKLSKPKRMFS